ncbi:MAG: bifunctional DNA primase/polymerase, partial [Candidatus Korarchaeota archaeon]|nr:bifunctional DNA primase/polymerase [Candidatus Korarchaeota archaeon]
MNDLLSWAKFYAEKGFSPIPLLPKEKRPHAKLLKAAGWIKENGSPTWEPAKTRKPSDKELEIWFKDKAPEDAGIGLVIPQGVAVVDLEKRELFPLFFRGASPETIASVTWIARTGKGYHIYMKLPKDAKMIKVDGWIELRTKEFLVTAPPSLHPSGVQYTWLSDPRKIEIDAIDEDALRRLLEKIEWAKKYKKLIERLIEAWTPSMRHNLAGPLAGFLRKRGISKEEAEFIVTAICLLTHDEELEDRLRFVRDTYEKSLDRIAGLTILKELLGDELLKDLLTVFPQSNEYERELELEEIKRELKNRDLLKLVIEVLSRLIKDDLRSLIYSYAAMLSAQLPNPTNLSSIAKSSDGKTYPIVTTAEIFPKDAIEKLTGATEKSFIYDHGVLVDENGKELEPVLRALKQELEFAQDKEEKQEIRRRIKEISRRAYRLVDLDGKILIFLEKPDDALLARLRPLLSRDAYETKYRYVKKNRRGDLETETIILRGWPVVIFCKTEEEQFPEWLEQQIQSRFLVISPMVSKEKYKKANALTADRLGLPSQVFQRKYGIKDLEMLKKYNTIVFYELRRLRKQVPPGTSFIWVPFADKIAEVFPAETGRRMRDFQRFFTLLHAVVGANIFRRPRLYLDGVEYVIATLEDLRITTELFRLTAETALTGLSERMLRFYREALKVQKEEGWAYFTISQLQEKIELSRQTIYYYLTRLERHGLAERNREEKADRWTILEKEIVPEFLHQLNEIDLTEEEFLQRLNEISDGCDDMSLKIMGRTLDWKELYNIVRGNRNENENEGGSSSHQSDHLISFNNQLATSKVDLSLENKPLEEEKTSSNKTPQLNIHISGGLTANDANVNMGAFLADTNPLGEASKSENNIESLVASRVLNDIR